MENAANFHWLLRLMANIRGGNKTTEHITCSFPLLPYYVDTFSYQLKKHCCCWLVAASLLLYCQLNNKRCVLIHSRHEKALPWWAHLHWQQASSLHFYGWFWTFLFIAKWISVFLVIIIASFYVPPAVHCNSSLITGLLKGCHLWLKEEVHLQISKLSQ